MNINQNVREKRKLAEQAKLFEEAEKLFPVGTIVVARFEGINYEGVVLEILPTRGGCMVQFEEQYLFADIGKRLHLRLGNHSKSRLSKNPRPKRFQFTMTPSLGKRRR